MSLQVTLAVQQPITNPVTREKLDQLVSTAVGTITGTVETAGIENGAVTGPKIAAGSVEEAKIAAGAVTADKIAAGAVNVSKMGLTGAGAMLVRNALGATSTAIQTSSSAGTWVDVTGLSVTLTLKEAASKVLVQAAVALGGSYAACRLVRGTDVLLQGDADGSRSRVGASVFRNDSALPLLFLDAPGSVGPHTYKVQFMTSNAATEARVNRATSLNDPNSASGHCAASSLVVIELFAMP